MKADRYLCLALAMLVTAGCARKSDDVTTPLHQAAAKGDVNQVQALLSQGADVDARDLGGRTPLHVAARDGHKDIVSLLLDNGANINALDKWGYSVLHRARHSGGDSVAELLLARGAYVRTQSQDGETPLHEAARHAWIELVTQLVAKGANVNTAARNGDTPLLRAILGYSEAEYDRYALDPERMKMVRFLIAKGGITSSDIATRALGVRRAIVLGQVAPGVPVWRLGPESRFPSLPYVIFPGNVGDDCTLAEIAASLAEVGA